MKRTKFCVQKDNKKNAGGGKMLLPSAPPVQMTSLVYSLKGAMIKNGKLPIDLKGNQISKR